MKVAVMHSVMKYRTGAGSEPYSLILSWLINMFPALRLRTMFQKQLAGYIGNFPKVRRMFLGLTEGQNWCSLSSVEMNQVYRVDLIQNLDDAFTKAAIAQTWCGRKTDQPLMLPQDKVFAPQAEIDKQTGVDYRVDLRESQFHQQSQDRQASKWSL